MYLAQNLDAIQNSAGLSGVGGDIGKIITDNLKYVFGAAGIALLIYLISGGMQLLFSRGDPKAAEGAKGKITNALIGFVIVVFAYFLASLFGKVLGIEIFADIFR